MTAEHLPPGFQGSHFTTTWQGLTVDGFTVPEQIGEIKTLTFNVQIPLKKAGIQLKLFGAADREKEIRELLASILNNLHGESNWKTGAVSASNGTRPDNYGYALLALSIASILVGLIVLMAISRFVPKGTVLAIAGGFYLASWLVPDMRIREVSLLVGTMRMFGFAAGILGIVDLVRKRKPRTASSHSEENPPAKPTR